MEHDRIELSYFAYQTNALAIVLMLRIVFLTKSG